MAIVPVSCARLPQAHPFRLLFGLLFLAMLAGPGLWAESNPFKHPGLYVDNVDLTFIRGNTAAGTVPAITAQPAGRTVNAGQTATFTVTATGTPVPTFQWQKNSTNISGATAARYTTPAMDAAAALRDCLAQLPPRARLLVERRYADDLPLAILAQQFKQKANTLAAALMRIRTGLQACMKDKGLAT